MIKLADDSFDITPFFGTEPDPFLCRIIALYYTYGKEPSFVDFWAQISDDKCTALIARQDFSVILYLTEKTDKDELLGFLRMLSPRYALCDKRFNLGFGSKETSGDIMTSDGMNSLDEAEKKPASPKEVYSVISKTELRPVSYEDFVLDLSHRLIKHTSRAYMIDNKSVVLTIAETENCAVLGALATLPEYRGQGTASRLITSITEELCNEGKQVFFNCEYGLTSYYKKLGFEVCGQWAEYEE